MPSFDNASYAGRDRYSAQPPLVRPLAASLTDFVDVGRFSVAAGLPRPLPLAPFYKLVVPGFNSFLPGAWLSPEKPPIL